MVEVRTRARFLSSQGAAASRKGLCPRTAAGWAAENISTVVVDIGHATSRFGFAGEDRPLQFPSVRGPVERAAWRGGITHARAAQAAGVLAGASRKRPSPSRRKGGQTGAAAGSAGAASAHESREARKFFVGDDALFLRRDHMQMNSHMEDGLVSDWDHFERLFTHGFSSVLSTVPDKHPLIVTEPSFNDRTKRAKYGELMFETLNAPAAFLAKDAVLSCYANGRQSGLVVDMGSRELRCTPVQEGFVMTKGLIRSPLAGDEMDRRLLRVLTDKNARVRPRYELRRAGPSGKTQYIEFSNTHPSYREYMRMEVVRDAKASLCAVCEDSPSRALPGAVTPATYELPDGASVTLEKERYEVPEIIFDPGAYGREDVEPLGRMITQSIYLCDMELRKDLYGGIVLVGGASTLPGCPERVYTEVGRHMPEHNMRYKALAATPQERKHGAWLGGSILGSLGSFHELYVSKAEWEEQGASALERKCP